MSRKAANLRVALYRLFAADGTLLYVGVTGDLTGRLKQHTAKTWWVDVASRDVEWFDSRDAAETAELNAIRTERPLHNSAGHHLSPPPPNGKAVGRPYWRPSTSDQEWVLMALRSQAALMAQVEADLWDLVRTGRAHGVPTNVVADESGISRATVYRKLGANRDLPGTAASAA